ncbi:MAG: hypothetical protein GY794_16150 [bacterium]|nr:hypothetical protein [bacterium]
MNWTEYRIIETDNFGGDYPDEKFINVIPVNLEHAEAIAKAINSAPGADTCPRYWRVVELPYELQPGFTP